MRRSAIHDMNEMNERVRILDGSIGSIDKQLKSLLEERVTGLAILDAGRTGVAKKMWISAEEENKLKLYERKLNDKVNEFEKRIGQAIAVNMNERHDIQEFRNHIMAIKQEIVALDQVALSVDFMTNQHGLLTGHVIEEQQQLKNLQFETIKKLKELQHDTQVECKKLEDQCNQMDAQMQAVEQALLEKPPDRASMNEIATKKATLKLEMRETKAKAETLETKLKTMLVRMCMQPTYTLREVEGAQPFYFISNDAFLENFQSFEDKVFKGETDITTKAMRIAQLESEIMMFNEEYESTMQQCACAREEQKEVIDLKCKQEQAAQVAVAAEEARLVRTESLLIDIERALANANDKLARAQPLHDNKAPLPIRQVFVPPVPDLAHIRTRKLLEARLFKMLGSKTVVLGTDLLCNAGTVDLLCHDRRERLILICFANPLTGYTIDTALVNHSAEIQAAFYMLRRLPPALLTRSRTAFSRLESTPSVTF